MRIPGYNHTGPDGTFPVVGPRRRYAVISTGSERTDEE
jgi:hypothetical protein